MRQHRPDRWVARLWLDFRVASNYPEQEPGHWFVKWYDVLWLLIPIAGIILFWEIPHGRYLAAKRRGITRTASGCSIKPPQCP